MHKKSIEAAHKLKEDDDKFDKQLDDEKDELSAPSGLTQNKGLQDRDEFRSESIASLRAKAQTYTAKMREGLGSSANLIANSNGHVFAMAQITSGHVDGVGDGVDPCSGHFEPVPPPPLSRQDCDDSTCDSESLDPTN